MQIARKLEFVGSIQKQQSPQYKLTQMSVLSSYWLKIQGKYSRIISVLSKYERTENIATIENTLKSIILARRNPLKDFPK